MKMKVLNILQFSKIMLTALNLSRIKLTLYTTKTKS